MALCDRRLWATPVVFGTFPAVPAPAYVRAGIVPIDASVARQELDPVRKGDAARIVLVLRPRPRRRNVNLRDLG